jgi:molybdopterin converting factor small subunit
MLVVQIRIYPPLSQNLGLAKGPGPVSLEQTIEPGDNLDALFRRLDENCPNFLATALEAETGVLVPYVSLFINGHRAATREDWQAPLNDSDEVVLLPAYAGG